MRAAPRIESSNGACHRQHYEPRSSNGGGGGCALRPGGQGEFALIEALGNILLPVLVLGIIRRMSRAKKTTAILITRQGGPMRGVVFLGRDAWNCGSFPDPTPGPGEVVLAIKASGMCGSDLHTYRAKGGTAAIGIRGRTEPVIAGHEPCGVWQRWGLASARHKRGWGSGHESPLCRVWHL